MAANTGSGLSGKRPASLSGVALTMIMKRMESSFGWRQPAAQAGSCRHDEGAAAESTSPPPWPALRVAGRRFADFHRGPFGRRALGGDGLGFGARAAVQQEEAADHLLGLGEGAV